jgi:ketosteroid isomerase-like protein
MAPMKKTVIAGAVIAASCAATAPPDALEPATSLASAEAAFAAHSVRQDSRAAFLANFAADGVFVRDGWVVARPALESQPAPPIVLDWHPVYVEAARSGELGISTGPWTITPHDRSKAALHGQFVSVWRRTDGRWQVIADIGVAHPVAALEGARLQTRMAPAAGNGDAASLASAERAFTQAAAHGGMLEAIREHGSDDMRFYREGQAPWLESARALPAEVADESPIHFTQQDMQVARSGDLGFARGTYVQPADGKHGVWLRAWRREGSAWRVSLAVANATR